MEDSVSVDLKEKNLLRNLKKVSVLYVEDEEYLRERLARILERRIGKLYLATNGKEGLEQFKKIQPDIVITDIRMPIMDGLEMAREIKKIGEDIPIMITTAHNDEEFLIRAIDVGIDKYLKKPVNRNDLVKMLSDVARSIIQQKEIEAKNEFIRMIMDNSPEFYLICDDLEISYLNKSILSFFGCQTFEDFKKQNIRLENHIELEGEDQPESEGGFCQQIIQVSDNADQDTIVRMWTIDQSSEDARSYLLRINRLPGHTEMLVILSDVTGIDRQKRHFEDLSTRDPLTEIFNRSKFSTELLKEVDRARRYERPIALIMMDIDFFKAVNDNYGHQVGDDILRECVEIINHNIRKTDFFARYGGEEFVLLLPETLLSDAIDLAEKLREKISTHKFPTIDKLTCSFGVSKLYDGEDGFKMLNRADAALYRAKNNGRNRVEEAE